MDCAGSDMAPCGSDGCHNKTMTAADCEDMCKATKGCAAYVFAAQSCNSGSAICWQKAHCEPKPATDCRAVAQAKGSPARPAKPAQPAGPGADIPSKYALNVSATSTPLVAYPRPQMVRGAGATATLREVGDPAVWTNLNGTSTSVSVKYEEFTQARPACIRVFISLQLQLQIRAHTLELECLGGTQ